jgi:dipeptidyl aminopeptidase/acylaminoacyl peptidase
VFVQRDADGGRLARARLADGAIRASWARSERDESWPTWSEPAHRLAFQVGRTGQGSRSDLWTWRPGDAAPAPIADTPRRDEAWPAWSPTAPQLGFAFRGGSQPPGVAVLTFGDGAPTARPIAEAAAASWFLRPRFAPDGASLVAQRRDKRDSQLWILSLAGEARALTRDATWFHLKGAFTRDGARVLFSRRPAAGGPADVASVDLRGGDLRIVASRDGADDHSGTPSPRRDELALVSDRDGNDEIYLAPLPDGPARRLTDTPEWDEGAPHWSPDGERLVVTATPRARSGGRLDGSRVRVIDREGKLLFETEGLMPDWMPAW